MCTITFPKTFFIKIKNPIIQGFIALAIFINLNIYKIDGTEVY
ncbi:hypothetical protein phi20c_0031 [Streptococcus phage phi20c]|nr:hypothetical protein phi20c_0031 [Streptococcus phage phi20c]